MSTAIEKLLPKREDFSQTIDGKKVDLFYLKNNDVTVALTNYGCRIVSLITKDKNGNDVDVVCGFSTLDDYIKATEFYHGAVIGRYANRIAKGKFSLNDKVYNLDTNNGTNHLHGGIKGFHDVVWDVIENNESRIIFQYLSINGEEGYPGNLNVTITYSLQEKDLVINFEAATDESTILTLTNHSYFNLNGQGSGSILNHRLHINADHFTSIDETLIPTGKLESVEDTPFDFKADKEIGKQIDDDNIQLKYGLGYDHNFVLNKFGNELTLAAKATGDKTAITLEVLTTEPGLQLYTGNFMKGENKFKGEKKDDFRTAFCLETQHFPDSPNHTNFPSTVLNKGETFKSTTIFRLK